MTDMGDASLVLGMQKNREREAGTLIVSHEQYTKSMLAGFGMAGCYPVHTTGASVELSRSARRHPARSHGNGALPIHHWVPRFSELVHAL